MHTLDRHAKKIDCLHMHTLDRHAKKKSTAFTCTYSTVTTCTRWIHRCEKERDRSQTEYGRAASRIHKRCPRQKSVQSNTLMCVCMHSFTTFFGACRLCACEDTSLFLGVNSRSACELFLWTNESQCLAYTQLHMVDVVFP